MNYFGMATTIVSHIVASLYIQKQKYNKWVIACLWALYAVFSVYVMMFQENIVIGFFEMLLVQAVIFYITSIGTFGEKLFVFLAYANSFCICLGANIILKRVFLGSIYLPVFTTGILILMHLFLYKVLIPKYKRAKMFFTSGWKKRNAILVLFFAQFLNQYAFSMESTDSLKNTIFDFAIFSGIFCFTLILLFDSVKEVAEVNKIECENDELKNVAYTDNLTGMKNRAAYAKFTRKQTLNYKRNEDLAFTFVMLDINGFKNINDTKGHDEGDKVLKCVGNFITKYFEDFEGESFRIGGDEFVLLLENMDLSDIEEELRAMNEQLFELNGVTLAYGCAEVNFKDAKPFEAAFKKADSIMYSNKNK